MYRLPSAYPRVLLAHSRVCSIRGLPKLAFPPITRSFHRSLTAFHDELVRESREERRQSDMTSPGVHRAHTGMSCYFRIPAKIGRARK